MTDKHEKRFLDALRDIFVGAKIEGEGGFINLMRIKSRYYENGVGPKLLDLIAEELKPFPEFREELFDKLYTFFKRYFSESGSIYFRHTPYSEDIYEKIYTDDRDVMLFWKTQNLYYVKTDRLFRSMKISLENDEQPTFWFDADAVAKQTFDFDASSLETKKNNEKRSLIFEYKGRSKKDDTLEFRVLYSEGGKRTKIIDILKAVKKDGLKVTEEQLTKAFRLFERQTEVDFFINKNARAFLTEQFDLWMYQYLFKHETEFREKRIKQLQVLKTIAYAIIDFISQFEDELVRVWNKPKFVRASAYIITFDRIREKSEDLARKFVKHSGFKAQVAEWKDLGMISSNIRPEALFGDELQHLPFDTKHFRTLETELLGLFDRLDDELDGRLIYGDNYQALRTLQPLFHGEINAIYIDPPYNTATSEIAYLNTFRHSSWASLVDNRLEIAKDFLDPKCGFICCAIDDVEQKTLSSILEEHFGELAGTVCIRSKPSGKPIPNGFAISHEYALFARLDSSCAVARLEHTDEQRVRYRENDGKGPFFWELLRKAGSGANRSDRPTMYYPFYLNTKTGKLRLPEMEYNKGNEEFVISEAPKKGEISILPRKDDGTEGRWYFGLEEAKRVIDEIKVENDENGDYQLYRRRRPNEGQQPMTMWLDAKYSATEHGTALLKALFGERESFSYPKSIYTVEDSLRVTGASKQQSGKYLDFFAGSGTTAHAVINLNRDDNGRRKYILIEANNYFHTVIVPRIKKVVFSDKWKDGRAETDGRGIPHFCKYFSLEQYEDSLRRAVYIDDTAGEPPQMMFDNPYETPFSTYVFLRDPKMSDVLDIHYDANKVRVNLSKLYNDIDWAETLSYVRGKFIKSQTADSVTFVDGETIKFDEIDYNDILPLIWWDK